MREQELLLRSLQQCDFTLYELQLYLDTHPNCPDALEYYRDMCAVRKKLVEEYTAAYGPLSSYDCFCGDDWTWVDQPWPWEGECK